MDDNLTYLFAAFLITWIVIGVYLWTLGRQVQTLSDEVAALGDDDSAALNVERQAVLDREQPVASRLEQ